MAISVFAEGEGDHMGDHPHKRISHSLLSKLSRIGSWHHPLLFPVENQGVSGSQRPFEGYDFGVHTIHLCCSYSSFSSSESNVFFFQFIEIYLTYSTV